MEIKHRIFKRGKRGGSNSTRKKLWVLRLEYIDPQSDAAKRVERYFEKREAAVDARPELEAKIRQTLGSVIVGDKMTFADLATKCKATFYKEAVILAGRKVDGVKSVKTTHGFINTLVEYFGKKRIGRVTAADLKAYKKWRFDRGSRRGNWKERDETISISLSTINRELATMRRIMKFAFAEGWVTKDIFAGAKVIDAGAELERSRTLTDAEEALLITFAERKKFNRRSDGDDVPRESPYLKAIILLALDSAMRKGEILKLRWEDIDLDRGLIRVVSSHTKTERERMVPLSDRAAAELRQLPSFGGKGDVFSIAGFKRSWSTTKRLAGVQDLRFHDLRRTAITRMNLRQVPLAVAGKIAGHARLETTVKHYVATDVDIVQSVAARINEANEERGRILETESIN
ncbi:MAG: tyrosine-type recombinase/integrase [Pyrinomonadaceae bacterium]